MEMKLARWAHFFCFGGHPLIVSVDTFAHRYPIWCQPATSNMASDGRTMGTFFLFRWAPLPTDFQPAVNHTRDCSILFLQYAQQTVEIDLENKKRIGLIGVFGVFQLNA